MPGTRIFTYSFLLLGAVSAAFAQPDYFPLEAGNIWIYRCTGACGPDSTITTQIGTQQSFNGISYTELQNWFGNNYLVRADGSGNLFAFDPNTNQEQLWYAFQTAEGDTYTESIPSGCCGRATLSSKSAHYEGPVGVFDNVLQVVYAGVFQVGVYQENFLPYVGLLNRGQAAGGPAVRNYDLIYARLGGATIVSQPELSMTLALDRAVYTDSATLTARLTIRNTTSDPVSLTFLTGQIYDLEIKNQKGDVVYRWSNGRLFPQIVSDVAIEGEKDYVITAPLADLPAGNYVAQAWLVADGPARAYSASAAFQIK